MPPRRVIGIDAGGTKLLGGVVDEQMVVHHRVHRTWRGADRQETLDIFTGAVEEVRAAAPDVEAIGFGVPALMERETGIVRWSNHLPALDGVPFRDLMSERLGLPVSVDNDGNASMLAESRGGAAQGARPRGDGLPRDRDRRRAARERRGVPGRDRRGRGARPCGAPATWPGLPGRLPRPGLLRGARVGERDRPRGAARGGGASRLPARPAARRGQGDQRRARDRAGARRRSARSGGARARWGSGWATGWSGS